MEKDSNQYCSQSAFFLYIEQRFHATLKTTAESIGTVYTNLGISNLKAAFSAKEMFDSIHLVFFLFKLWV